MKNLQIHLLLLMGLLILMPFTGSLAFEPGTLPGGITVAHQPQPVPPIPEPQGINQTLTSATIVRTIVYRQISDFQRDIIPNNIRVMKISADGTKIIFTADYPVRVFTVNPDGKNLIKIFDYSTLQNRGWNRTDIDISADGSKVIWTDGVGEIYIANSDGSNQQRIATTFPGQWSGTEGPNFPLRPRITADGKRIYFLHIGGGPDIAGGYRILADGSGQTQLFSYRQMSKQLFGQSGDEMNGNIAFRDQFDISDDGSRMVFGTVNFGASGHTITFDGSQLRKIADFAPLGDNSFAISGDGTKIAFKRGTVQEGRAPVNVMNFDGSNLSEIGYNIGEGVIHNMTRDGAEVLAGGVSLFHTNGSGQLDLAVLDFWRTAEEDVFYRIGIGPTVSISADGRRFCFKNERWPDQLWVADINPVTIGDAPLFTQIDFSPDFIVTNPPSVSTFTAYISGGTGGVRRMGFTSFKNGTFKFRYLGGNLFDDATNGDVQAGDGIFTNNQVQKDLAPVDQIHPLEIRISAISGNMHQVTAVDATPFFILDQTPSQMKPVITSIDPASAQSGSQVTIRGNDFDPSPANNIVLFGNRQAFVVAGTAMQLTVIVPADLPRGAVLVTVTVKGQISNSYSFNHLTGMSAPEALPLTFHLNQNYPNPFNATTVIEYQLPHPSAIEFWVFNLQGQKVIGIQKGVQGSGHHQIIWNGTNEAGQPVTSGVYIYQLTTENNIEIRKMLLLR